MNDVRDDLRELLRRRADHVPPHREIPRSLVGRARRRIALNALGLGLAVAVLAGGAFAGVRAFGAAPAPQPAGRSNNPPTQPQPTPPASTTSACTSAQVQAMATTEGAAGSRDLTINLSNVSATTCTVQGTPAITLLDENRNPITSGVEFSQAPPQWKADGSPEPPGWPVVTLLAGHSALVRARWSNWCPQGRAVPVWQMDVPGGGTVDVNGIDPADPPPCNGPGQPSTIEEGPFEPPTGP